MLQASRMPWRRGRPRVPPLAPAPCSVMTLCTLAWPRLPRLPPPKNSLLRKDCMLAGGPHTEGPHTKMNICAFRLMILEFALHCLTRHPSDSRQTLCTHRKIYHGLSWPIVWASFPTLGM